MDNRRIKFTKIKLWKTFKNTPFPLSKKAPNAVIGNKTYTIILLWVSGNEFQIRGQMSVIGGKLEKRKTSVLEYFSYFNLYTKPYNNFIENENELKY